MKPRTRSPGERGRSGGILDEARCAQYLPVLVELGFLAIVLACAWLLS